MWSTRDAGYAYSTDTITFFYASSVWNRNATQVGIHCAKSVGMLDDNPFSPYSAVFYFVYPAGSRRYNRCSFFCNVIYTKVFFYGLGKRVFLVLKARTFEAVAWQWFDKRDNTKVENFVKNVSCSRIFL